MLNIAFAFLLGLAQEAPEKASPFTAVKWEDEKPLVQFEGDWYEFVSIDGIGREELIAACRKDSERRWQKRFSEDLVEMLKKLGKTPKATVTLVLAKEGKRIEKTGTLTEENRRKVSRSNSGRPEAAPRPPPYEFESARIVFKFSGAFEGTDTFHVADSGNTLVLEQDKKILTRERKTAIWKDGKLIVLDHDAKRLLRSPLKLADMDLSIRHAGDDTLKRIGLLRVGTETVAGRECVLYEKKDGDKLWRSWRWKGIELKIEMKNYLGLSYVKEALSVEEGVAIPEELFKIPEGYPQK
jgi:hypothetical protein